MLDLIEGDYDVADGLTAIHAPGHTPGHMGMLISSGNERALIIGDIAGSPMHISEPDLPYNPDFNPEEGRASRHRLLDIAAAFDRIDRADGADDIRSDRRLTTLREAARLLTDGRPERARRVQLQFSDAFDDSWRQNESPGDIQAGSE